MTRPYRSSEKKLRWIVARMRQLSLFSERQTWLTGREIAERAGYVYSPSFRQSLYDCVDREFIEMRVIEDDALIRGVRYEYRVRGER